MQTASLERPEISLVPFQPRIALYVFNSVSKESTDLTQVQLRRPSPKKRNVRKTRKPTFNDLSTNGPRLRATRGRPPKAPIAIGRGRERERQRESHKDIATSNPYRPNIFTQPPPTLNPLVGFTNGYNSHGYMASVDEEEEYRLTVGDFGKKKSAFSIFEDEISPAGTESPLEESQYVTEAAT